MNVLGLDLSLTATGVAYCDGSTDTWTVKATGPHRLIALRDRMTSLLCAHVDLVVIEDYAYAGKFAHSHELGELGGVIRVALHEHNIPWVAIVPTSLKKFATGKGTAKKVEMLLAAAKRLRYDGHDDNQADALWLRAMALDFYGEPIVDMPAVNREALTKVAWPDLAAAA